MNKQKEDQKREQKRFQALPLEQAVYEGFFEVRDDKLIRQKIEYHAHPEKMTFEELININDL